MDRRKIEMHEDDFLALRELVAERGTEMTPRQLLKTLRKVDDVVVVEKRSKDD